jgi:hypothetical protein
MRWLVALIWLVGCETRGGEPRAPSTFEAPTPGVSAPCVAGTTSTIPARVPPVVTTGGYPTGTPPTRWHGGKLWVFDSQWELAAPGHVYDPCTREWTAFAAGSGPGATAAQPRLAHVVPVDATGMALSGGALDPRHELRPASSASIGTHHGWVFAGATVLIDGSPAFTLPAKDAPTPRSPQTFLMRALGDDLVVWGGLEARGVTNEGAIYDAKSRAWRPMAITDAPLPRMHVPVAEWTGRELIVWGGTTQQGEAWDGGIYDVAANRWRAMSTTGAPPSTAHALSAWTGSKLLHVGVRDASTATAALYDPATDRWQPVAVPHTLYPGYRARAWQLADDKLLFATLEDVRVASVLDARAGTWTRIDLPPKLSPRKGAAIHYTGTHLIVYGGWTHKQTRAGGGCESPPPNVGCDPVPPTYEIRTLADGALFQVP